MRQPTWTLFIVACIICLLIGYLVGRVGAQKKALEQIEEVQELRRESDLVAQKAVLMSNRAGETLKRAMEEITRMLAWNGLIVAE